MKALLLLSSGIDSPVAGRMMKDKGLELTALHFRLVEDKKEENKIISLAKKAGADHLLIADLRPFHEEYKERANARFTCVVCKRMMLRAAQKLAEKKGFDVLITGENLGQVASQTLDNLSLINSAVKIKLLSPLIGFDKKEIVKMAKGYSTYELSVQKSPACPYLPKKPITRAKQQKLEDQEARLEIEKLASKAADNIIEIY